MFVLFDTNILIDIENGKANIPFIPNSEPAICWATYYEYYFGDSSGKSCNFLDAFAFLEMDKKSARIFCDLKKKMKNEKNKIGDFDLMIASVAMANDALLITRDSDFNAIKGLKFKIL